MARHRSHSVAFKRQVAQEYWDCPVFVDGSGGLAEQGIGRGF